MMLSVYLLYEIELEPGQTDFFDGTTVEFFYSAIPIQYVFQALSKEKATDEYWSVWTCLLAQIDDNAGWLTPRTRRLLKGEAYLRMVLDLLVNEVVELGLMLLLPIILCTSETHIDFIKDCLAMQFIAQIDDLDYEAEIQEPAAHAKMDRRSITLPFPLSEREVKVEQESEQAGAGSDQLL